jgi:hypothetical protein
MRPAVPTIQIHASVPASTGHRRASRNTPSFTIAAECRYADTGVGAAIACGSQKWNGNWALLVSAPMAMRMSAGRYSECSRIRFPELRTRSRS